MSAAAIHSSELAAPHSKEESEWTTQGPVKAFEITRALMVVKNRKTRNK